MPTISVPLKGGIGIPFATIKNDPLLLIRNFPHIQSVERLGEWSFKLTSKPMAVSNFINRPQVWFVTLEIEENQVRFVRPAAASADQFYLTGKVRPLASGVASTIDLVAGISVEEQFGGLLSGTFKNMAQYSAGLMLREFEYNLHTPQFENTVQDFI